MPACCIVHFVYCYQPRNLYRRTLALYSFLICHVYHFHRSRNTHSILSIQSNNHHLDITVCCIIHFVYCHQPRIFYHRPLALYSYVICHVFHFHMSMNTHSILSIQSNNHHLDITVCCIIHFVYCHQPRIFYHRNFALYSYVICHVFHYHMSRNTHSILSIQSNSHQLDMAVCCKIHFVYCRQLRILYRQTLALYNYVICHVCHYRMSRYTHSIPSIQSNNHQLDMSECCMVHFVYCYQPRTLCRRTLALYSYVICYVFHYHMSRYTHSIPSIQSNNHQLDMPVCCIVHFVYCYQARTFYRRTLALYSYVICHVFHYHMSRYIHSIPSIQSNNHQLDITVCCIIHFVYCHQPRIFYHRTLALYSYVICHVLHYHMSRYTNSILSIQSKSHQLDMPVCCIIHFVYCRQLRILYRQTLALNSYVICHVCHYRMSRYTHSIPSIQSNDHQLDMSECCMVPFVYCYQPRTLYRRTLALYSYVICHVFHYHMSRYTHSIPSIQSNNHQLDMPVCCIVHFVYSHQPCNLYHRTLALYSFLICHVFHYHMSMNINSILSIQSNNHQLDMPACCIVHFVYC
ncbi:hypothetical protein DPMN_097277 [Dreissena polymorpha]|uniref:Uncharacterized protein n=1 Tax=Dreissena polymorpha TaxID=45954 RepID=A0A9D4R5A2_DREPO|nr:hypothetical protein DPMN_097277 [Dreissena polymorpha]